MESLINRVQQQLDDNHAVEAEDIQALVNKLNNMSLALIHWKERCKKAEKYIALSPCDPDIYKEQLIAYREWQEFKENPYGIFNTDNNGNT